MNALVYIVLAVHVLSSVGLIVFVLLHSGKGTGLSSMLGGSVPATGSGTGIIEKNLDRITIGFAGAYAISALILMMTYHPGA